MNPNDTTTFGADSQPKAEPQENNRRQWQTVSIGGVTGILMGAAAMYAATAKGSEEPEMVEGENGSSEAEPQMAPEGLSMATVDGQLSFGEAFRAARSEVGPGGLFRWHGGLYNTFTKDEWDAMGDDEKQAFAQQAQPELASADPDSPAARPAAAQHAARHDDGHEPAPEAHARTAQHEAGHEADHHDADEPEVHFLGVEARELEDGSTINVGHMTISNQEVAVVDLDDDYVFDVAISDRNQNQRIDEDEVIDISEQQLSVVDFALASAEEAVATQQGMEQASMPQEPLADDMPDYMNDADVQSL